MKISHSSLLSVLVFVENAWDQSNKQGILLSTALMVGWNYSESYNLRVELNQMGLGRGFFFFGGRASININQPPSTFHTSTFAARGPRVHLPWPLVTISSSNDGFPQVTGREIQGQKSPMLLQSNCASKTSALRFPAGLVLKQMKQITNSMFSTDFSFFYNQSNFIPRHLWPHPTLAYARLFCEALVCFHAHIATL